MPRFETPQGEYGLEPHHLDSGWTFNGHDGMATITSILDPKVARLEFDPATKTTTLQIYPKQQKCS
jgi:hypothetical protein